MAQPLVTRAGTGKTTLEDDDERITGYPYVRLVGGPRRDLRARRIFRPGRGSAGRMAGRADARRARFRARLQGAPDGAALGPDRLARGRGGHARRHLQAVGPSPARQTLAARGARGLRHAVVEPGGRTAAL